MYRKLLYLICFVVVLSIANNASADLIGYWKFNESSGTTAEDSSGNGNDGTLIGDPQWVAGNLGSGALEFNGDDYVEISPTSFNTNTDFTWTAWIKTDSDGTIIAFAPASGDWAPGGKTLFVRGGTLGVDIGWVGAQSSPTAVDDGQWHHVALTAEFETSGDNETTTLYVDGQPDHVRSDWNITMDAETDMAVKIGFTNDNFPDDPWFVGQIDDARIYDHALSADEIVESMIEVTQGPAGAPLPNFGATDVPRDGVVLSWEPGEYAAEHDIYIGDNFDDVNDADRTNPMGVLVSQGQAPSTYALGRLDFSQTYYWRVDEVNDTSPPLDENFDSLDVGANLHDVEGWEGWYGDEEAGGYVTADQAYSGNHSLEFARPVDLVPHWERKTSGTWILTTMQYVPSTATSGSAYYGVLSGYVEANLEWIASVVSDFENDVVILDGLDPEPELPLVRDDWAEIRVEVDLDAQVSNFYYNGELLGTHGADNTTGLEGIDLWAESDDVIYFDDFLLVSDPLPELVIFKGDVWQFTVEPISYVIENVTATASSSDIDQGPENTVNGSGLDNDRHSTELTEMWISAAAGPQPTWIQYEFDKVYKLHEMWVWNSNGILEQMVGVGFKDVSIEYSVNGIDYTTLGTTHEFAQGTAAADYEHNTTVDFGGAAAKFVRLTANSSWVGFLPQFGLSEVRFFSIRARATEPSPDSGATDVDLDLTLSFRAGRGAAKHDVYLSTDEQAVIDGTAPVISVTEASYSTSLDIGSTYYWRVDEVNDAETPTTWQGDIWNLSTPEFLLVDDFESYNETPAGEEGSNLVYETWIDGYDNPLVNGSVIGYFRGDTLEYSVVCSGKQSAPLYYNNYTAGNSEVTANIDDLQIGQDWTKGGAETLVLWIRGALSNNAAADQLYVKINDAKVVQDSDLSVPLWTQLNVDLASLGIDLSNITTLSIGVEGSGSGMLHVDDIALYRIAPPVVEPTPGSDKSLVGHWKLDETSGLIAADSSGYGNDGTLMNMVGDEWTAGVVDGALMLDGSQYVDFGNPKHLQLTGEVTISAWVKMEPGNADAYMGIAGKMGSTTGANRGFVLVRHSSNVFRLWVVTDGGFNGATSDVTYNDTDWHHLVGVASNATGSLYVDGVKQAIEAEGELQDSGDYAFIGRQYDEGSDDRLWNGIVDDVRIYYRALSEQEILGF